MRYIRDIYTASARQQRPVISFEFFPPKTPEGERTFFEKTAPALAELKPDFCSVTYGAGGSTREKTLSIVDRLQRQHGIPALAHLTCVGSTRTQVVEIAEQAQAMGIQNILALRGDPPAGTTEWPQVEGGLSYAHELVTLLREIGGFSVGVAGFPEGHIACKEGKLADWEHLRAKIDRGADFVITQLFFNNAHYYALRDHLAARSVSVPIVPGIIPILGSTQIKKFTALCGAELPALLLSRLDSLADDDAVAEFGIEYASQQCAELLEQGAPGIHFYTLNKSRSTTRILSNLGCR